MTVFKEEKQEIISIKMSVINFITKILDFSEKECIPYILHCLILKYMLLLVYIALNKPHSPITGLTYISNTQPQNTGLAFILEESSALFYHGPLKCHNAPANLGLYKLCIVL